MRLQSYAASRDGGAIIAPADQIDSTMAKASGLTDEELAQVAKLRERTAMGFADAVINLGFATRESVNRTIVEHHPAGLIDPETSGVSAAVVAAFDTDDPLTVKLRALRARLFNRDDMLSGRMYALVLTGVGTGDCSGLAANFAVLVAQLGQPVLLVDANFAAPTQHALFGILPGEGLTSLLNDTNVAESAIVATPISNLDLLRTGPAVPLLSETLERVSLITRLRALRKVYAFVIVDAGDQQADIVAALARGADGLVPVVERGSTDLQRLKALFAHLERNGIPVPGTVLA